MFFGYFPLLLCLGIIISYGSAYKLKIDCDGPIVLGATLNCTTWVLNEDKSSASGQFRYTWRDNAIPEHSKVVESGPNSTWSITYDRTNYTAGYYIIRVDVCKLLFNFICTYDTSSGTFIYITESLNGEITLTQGNDTRNTFVSTANTLNQSVTLKDSDKNYISQAPSVLSYWFVDCVYYGITTDLDFEFNFSKPEENHVIEALVVGDFTPLPPPTTTPPSTTSTTPVTTTKSTTTTKGTTSTTTKAPATGVKTAAQNSKSKRGAPPFPLSGNSSMLDKNYTLNNGTQSNIKIWDNGKLVAYNGNFPYVCNSTVITTDSKKVYGYFQKVITTKAPVSNVTVSGNNWLQHGELLSLNVNCKGSEKMQFCYFFKPGLYNVTGNETCNEYSDLDKCDFPIQRYFQDQHTVIIIIKNEVSKKVSSVAITVYKVKRQAQLSVIVVPVAFTLVAVVLVVFGVAYYIQNRSRFTVEVADFDFCGQKYADLEYKTFRDRLKDSIVNAFTRDPMPSTSGEPPVWPPGHKYGSMT